LHNKAKQTHIQMVTLKSIITFCVTCRSRVQLQIVKKCTLAGLWLGETPQFDTHTHIRSPRFTMSWDVTTWHHISTEKKSSESS
jgi:hypothetical protein